MAEPGIYKRTGANGTSYQAVVDLGRDPATGRRRQKRRTFKTRRDAIDWRRKTLTEVRQRVFTEPSREPFSVAAEHWLATRDVDGSTLLRYRVTLDNQVLPVFGSVPLAEITPRMVQDLYNRHRDMGSRHIVRVVVGGVLKQAVNEGLLPTNPAANARGMSQPKTDRAVQVWDAETLAAFLAATEGSRHHALWWTLAYTGMRIGEAAALTWTDVDLDTQVIQVRATITRDASGVHIGDGAKSDASERRIPIDAATARILNRHRLNQAERRLAHGHHWYETGLVFDRGDGTALSINGTNASFARQCRNAGLPVLNVHGLRHSHATALLIAGRPIHYVSKRLGHANITITLSLYAHVLPNTEHEDAEVFAALMTAARQRQQRQKLG